MSIEDHRISSGDYIDNITCQSRDGMSGWRDRAHYTKRGVFLQSNPMISAARIGSYPVDARHKLDDL